MKIYLVLIMSFFVIVQNAQAIIINEIMPNPDDGCYDCSEWIEITTNESASLDNITADTGENPIMLNGSIAAGEFIIITKNLSAFSGIWNPENITIFENTGMSLKNAGDNITLYNDSDVLHAVEYLSSANNKSYGMCNQSIVTQNISTPGTLNVCTSDESNGTNDTQITCDLYLWIKCNDTFTMGNNKYYPMVEDLEGGDFEPEVEYWIEDLFGNIVRSKFRTNNTNVAKSWTPPEITGTEAYMIHAVITNEVCNDTNHSNNNAEKLIVVKGEEPYSDSECSCENQETQICSYDPCPPCNSEEETEEEADFEILSCPDEIEKDDEIEIKVNMKNPSPNMKNYTLYSYVYEGNKPVSLGLDKGEWINTWNANRQNVSIPGNSSVSLTLKNRIAEDTEPGEYKMRVRIWLDDKKHDMTRDIQIKEPKEPAKPANQTIQEEN
ncbi:MAG: lamin tail domain-containing protein, partial [Candidatus Aenigmarchaeota archaeon]